MGRVRRSEAARTARPVGETGTHGIPDSGTYRAAAALRLPVQGRGRLQ